MVPNTCWWRSQIFLLLPTEELYEWTDFWVINFIRCVDVFDKGVFDFARIRLIASFFFTTFFSCEDFGFLYLMLLAHKFTDFILLNFFQQIRQSYIFHRFFVLLYISWSIARHQAKTLIVKFNKLSIKTSISGISWMSSFFQQLTLLPIVVSHFRGNLRLVIR